jgi:hypothetical protein
MRYNIAKGKNFIYVKKYTFGKYRKDEIIDILKNYKYIYKATSRDLIILL